MAAGAILQRIERLPWPQLQESLWAGGYAKTDQPVLTAEECDSLKHMYAERARFRSRVEMERFRFGVRCLSDVGRSKQSSADCEDRSEKFAALFLFGSVLPTSSKICSNSLSSPAAVRGVRTGL